MFKIILIVLAVGLLVFLGYQALHDNNMPLPALVQNNSNTATNSPPTINDRAELVPTIARNHDEVHAILSAQELFEVAEQLYFCKAIPKSDTELSIWLENARQNGEPDPYIENVVGRYGKCSDLATREQNYLVLLIEAAELGADEAVALLWSISDKEYFEGMNFTQMSREETISSRYEFTKKKFELAHTVALQGGEKSLSRLIRDYQHHDPFTKGQSYYKSVAYADFALATTLDNDFYQRIDWIKQRLIRKMSLEEIEQAQTLTELLLAEAANEPN